MANIEHSLEDTLQRMLDIALIIAVTADLAGVTLLATDDDLYTPYYIDPRSPRIDRTQYDHGRGPGLDAWRDGRIVHIADIDQVMNRYPDFVLEAKRHGVQAVIGLPLPGHDRGRPVGTLSLYSRRAASFSDHDIETLSNIAELIGFVVVNASAYRQATQLGQQLTEAMRSRAVIEQAKGVIMASTGTDSDGAFDLLRQQSQAENRKVRDLATELVERQTHGAGPVR